MDYISGVCKSKRRLEGWTIIVTGCNTGIGKETVLDFYKRGARVIMACRNVEKAEAAKSDIEKSMRKSTGTGELLVEKLDLCSFQSVREFSARVTSPNMSIHALVCNAGVMMCPESRTDDGFEMHIGSNHLAHALLSLLLLPTMIRTGSARIIFLSSYVHEKHELDLNDLNFEKKPYNAFQAYCKSKAANVMFGRALADKLKENNILNVTTYSVHPGVVRSDIGRHFDKTFASGATFAFNNVMGIFLQSTKSGAQTSIYCTIDETCAEESGLYYSDCAVKKPSKQCQDNEQIAKLWDETIKALKINLQKYNPFGNQNATDDAFL